MHGNKERIAVKNWILSVLTAIAILTRTETDEIVTDMQTNLTTDMTTRGDERLITIETAVGERKEVTDGPLTEWATAVTSLPMTDTSEEVRGTMAAIELLLAARGRLGDLPSGDRKAGEAETSKGIEAEVETRKEIGTETGTGIGTGIGMEIETEARTVIGIGTEAGKEIETGMIGTMRRREVLKGKGVETVGERGTGQRNDRKGEGGQVTPNLTDRIVKRLKKEKSLPPATRNQAGKGMTRALAKERLTARRSPMAASSTGSDLAKSFL